MNKLNPHIVSQTTSKEELNILMTIIRARIRREIALLLGEQTSDNVPPGTIVRIYRARYPESKDESFVAMMLDNLRWSFYVGTKKPRTEEGNKY